MSQCAEIIAYMKEHGSITSREAMMELDCGRLASRINDLRYKQGYLLRKETEERITKNGVKKRYARYYLRTAYCVNCDCKQPYTMKDGDLEFIRMPDGSTRPYRRKVTFCRECGEEVFVPEIAERNFGIQEQIYEEYRAEKDKEDVKKRYAGHSLKTAFCIDCGEHQPYTVQTVPDEFTMPNGKTERYIAKKAVCAECGSEVYVADVNDWNCKAREQAYETWRELKSKEDEND